MTTLYAAKQNNLAKQPPTVVAGAYALIDAETGLVLLGKNMDEPYYPASITKVMTALLALEYGEKNLDEQIFFSHNAVYSLPYGASHIAMDEDESLTLLDALYGLLLSSANEVANAIAEHIGGDIGSFAIMMNERAKGLGALDTNFVNPSGLHSPGHITTAHDMSLIMREAIKHPVFCEIIATRRYDIPPTKRKDSVRELLNSNKLIQSGSYYNEWVVGGKTGFHDEARHTLVTYAVKDERQLISVVLFDDNPALYTDTTALLDYGFSVVYEERKVFDHTTFSKPVPVYNLCGSETEYVGDVALRSAQSLFFPLPESFSVNDITYNVNIPESIMAPVYGGDVIGSLSCYVRGFFVGAVSLTASETVLPSFDSTETFAPMVGQDDGQPSFDSGSGPMDADANILNVYDGQLTVLPNANTPVTEDWLLTLVLPAAAIALTVAVSVLVIALRHRKEKRANRLSGKNANLMYVYKYK